MREAARPTGRQRGAGGASGAARRRARCRCRRRAIERRRRWCERATARERVLKRDGHHHHNVTRRRRSSLVRRRVVFPWAAAGSEGGRGGPPRGEAGTIRCRRGRQDARSASTAIAGYASMCAPRRREKTAPEEAEVLQFVVAHALVGPTIAARGGRGRGAGTGVAAALVVLPPLPPLRAGPPARRPDRRALTRGMRRGRVSIAHTEGPSQGRPARSRGRGSMSRTWMYAKAGFSARLNFSWLHRSCGSAVAVADDAGGRARANQSAAAAGRAAPTRARRRPCARAAGDAPA